jgi:hypothetical protein
MALRKLCNHPDLVTADYCECRTQEEKSESESLSVIAAPSRKKKVKMNGEVIGKACCTCCSLIILN